MSFYVDYRWTQDDKNASHIPLGAGVIYFEHKIHKNASVFIN
jgi:hypothetical protein